MWNTLKLSVLMAGLTGLVGAAGYGIGGSNGLVLSLVMAGVMNLGMVYFSSNLALRAYRARTVTADEAPELYMAVDRLRTRAGLPMPKVAVADMEQPNAFATGRSPADGVVCVTTGLLERLSPQELDAVLAHELAHIKNRDTLLMSVAATLAGALSNVGLMAMFGGAQGEDGEGPSPLAMVLGMLVAPIAGSLLQLTISRHREFDADRVGAAICGRPRDLVSALWKLEVESRYQPVAMSPAAASLAIINPLGPLGGRMSRWFSTHPSTGERVRRLEALPEQPTHSRAA